MREGVVLFRKMVGLIGLSCSLSPDSRQRDVEEIMRKHPNKIPVSACVHLN